MGIAEEFRNQAHVGGESDDHSAHGASGQNQKIDERKISLPAQSPWHHRMSPRLPAAWHRIGSCHQDPDPQTLRTYRVAPISSRRAAPCKQVRVAQIGCTNDAPRKLARERSAPRKFALFRKAACRLTPVKSACARFTPHKSALVPDSPPIPPKFCAGPTPLRGQEA